MTHGSGAGVVAIIATRIKPFRSGPLVLSRQPSRLWRQRCLARGARAPTSAKMPKFHKSGGKTC
ncbi:MAG: hypothetical protein DCC68_16020 [Planctomycetota bacterium]|nr:MAG: hypothetical protein DCC68_16020 [Planctomycetota bacterium]